MRENLFPLFTLTCLVCWCDNVLIGYVLAN